MSRPPVDRTSVNTLEELRTLVHIELQALLSAQNSHNPAINLPAEILVDIFRLSCLSIAEEDLPDTDVSYELFTRLTRTAIASTCSHWRNVILHDSLMWRFIHRPPKSWPPRETPPIFDNITSEIKRCGERTLFLDLETKQSDIPHVATLLEINVHRLEELSIMWSDEIQLADFQIFNGVYELPKLERLSLNWSHICSYDEGDTGATVDLSQALSLLHLRLSSINESGFMNQPWSVAPPVSRSIKFLEIWGWFEAGSVVDLLNSCAALETLVRYADDSSGDRDHYENLKPMASLRSLRFGNGMPFRSIQDIQAPNLQHLCLCTHPPSPFRTYDDHHIPAVIFPHLTSLILSGVPGSALTFLRNHNSLEALELIDKVMDDDLIRYLASTVASDSLSKLKCLIIKLETDESLAPSLPLALEQILHRPATDTPFKLCYREYNSDASRAVDRSKINDLLASYPETFSVIPDDAYCLWPER